MKLIALLVLFCAQSAFAVVIKDPNGVLTQVEALLANQSQPLFKVGDTVLVDRLVESCEIACHDPEPGTIGGCGSMCKEVPLVVDRTVAQVADGKAIITGQDGFYQEITDDQVKTCKANLGHIFITNLPTLFNFDGTALLTHLTSFDFPLGTGTAKERKEKAYSINGRFFPTGYQSSFDFKVSIIPTAPGVGQVALFSASGQVWFRLKDY